MDAAWIELSKVGDGDTGADLAVDAIARLQDDFLAFGNFQERRDVGMVAVMAGARLGGKRLGTINTDGVHGGAHVRGRGRRRSLHCRALALQQLAFPGRRAARERCAADPGSLQTPSFERSRFCSAAPQRAQDARERAYGAALRPGYVLSTHPVFTAA
jgi:hypothetical protein